MKFLLTTFCLSVILFFAACESPRLIFPDIDYGVIIDSSDSPVFSTEQPDSTSIILTGDRLKATDSTITIFSNQIELKFSYNTTIKDMIKANIDLGNETIIKMTDHFSLRNVGKTTDNYDRSDGNGLNDNLGQNVNEDKKDKPESNHKHANNLKPGNDQKVENNFEPENDNNTVNNSASGNDKNTANDKITDKSQLKVHRTTTEIEFESGKTRIIEWRKLK
ncbi:MAG: hypothetical protein LC102_02295 [Ignavibacteriales bacterium]|nr:MAG: hypothetical protein F9K26_01805 [Ignavibacteriaceae bacterium]MBW7872173.1 hypothetical protein [Ignavibacteria bacterium]MCZ2142243.1 hypothetical protein [Ignavibacteriales bacterium]MBV6445682.1 hypothetical protein [Ignavibacteriaceae bacterium]MBZ0197346.1 hypothetical protein [Ignavibacteriaceae bacterium]